jgi:hypothetical protein
MIIKEQLLDEIRAGRAQVRGGCVPWRSKKYRDLRSVLMAFVRQTSEPRAAAGANSSD